jgi:hypothetical protein
LISYAWRQFSKEKLKMKMQITAGRGSHARAFWGSAEHEHAAMQGVEQRAIRRIFAVFGAGELW